MKKLFIFFVTLGLWSSGGYAAYTLSSKEQDALIQKIDKSLEKQKQLFKQYYLQKERAVQQLVITLVALGAHIADEKASYSHLTDERAAQAIRKLSEKIERLNRQIYFVAHYTSGPSSTRMKAPVVAAIEKSINKEARRAFTASFADNIQLARPQNIRTALRNRIDQRKKAAVALYKQLQTNAIVQFLKKNKFKRAAQALEQALKNHSVRAAIAVALRDAQGLDTGAIANSVERRPGYDAFAQAVRAGSARVPTQSS